MLGRRLTKEWREKYLFLKRNKKRRPNQGLLLLWTSHYEIALHSIIYFLFDTHYMNKKAKTALLQSVE